MSTLERKKRIALSLPNRRVLACAALLCATLSAAPLRAQDSDLAEAARQARERKAAGQNSARHVYTDDDLKRNKILTRDDENRVVSRTAPQPSQTADENQDAPSLGEVARRYRREKAARQTEQAANRTAPPRYPMEVPGNTLATPKPEVMPGSGSLHNDELKPAPRKFVYSAPRSHAPVPRNIAPVPKSVSPEQRAKSASRVSPFARRELVIPRRSMANASLAELAGSLSRQKVQPGDSWWKLADRYLGSGSRWAEMLRVNPGVNHDPGRLPAGIDVFVPGNARTRATAPRASMVVVEKGDTFWSLAREHLGGGQFWPQLAAANPQITQLTRLKIGTKLKLPERSTPASAAPARAP